MQCFTFLPIENPRPSLSDGETYARRQHQFQEPSSQGRKQSFFDKIKVSSPASPPPEPTSPSAKEPPRFRVDARLPNPAIVTCNDSLPLRVLVKQLSERPSNLYLQMLHVELIGYTKIRAQDAFRTESNSWMVVTMSNMAIPLGSLSDPVGTETAINNEYWSNRPLPNSVPPSFDTCNITRHYELEVRVGLGYGNYEHGKDQLVVLPLRLPVQVYSGIAPPPALLKSLEAGQAKSPTASFTQQPGRTQGVGQLSSGPADTIPFASSSSSSQGTVNPSSYEDAPPSYEDAIAQDLPPIDGPRRNYEPPPNSSSDLGMTGGSKRKS